MCIVLGAIHGYLYYNCYSGYCDYMVDKTTIQITKTTQKRICEHGKKGETYDQIINHILDVIEEV